MFVCAGVLAIVISGSWGFSFGYAKGESHTFAAMQEFADLRDAAWQAALSKIGSDLSGRPPARLAVVPLGPTLPPNPIGAVAIGIFPEGGDIRFMRYTVLQTGVLIERYRDAQGRELVQKEEIMLPSWRGGR